MTARPRGPQALKRQLRGAGVLAQTAFHEAAHAFAGWLQGGVLGAVTVRGGEPHDDVHGSKYALIGFVNAAGGIDRRRLMTELCPAYAEERLFGEISWGSLYHLLIAAVSLSWPRDAELKPFIEAAMEANPASGGVSRKQIAERLYELTVHEIGVLFDDPRSWEALYALASAIIERGRLSGCQAAAILEKAWGELPEGALPASRHQEDPCPLDDHGRLVRIEALAAEARRLLGGMETRLFEDLSRDLAGIRLKALFWMDLLQQRKEKKHPKASSMPGENQVAGAATMGRR